MKLINKRLNQVNSYLSGKIKISGHLNIKELMNTKISVVKSIKGKDNLLILSDNNDFGWTTGFISESEIQILKHAAKNEITSVLLPRAECMVVVQFLKESANPDYSREDARLAGNEILSSLSHYKIKEITVLNRRKANRLAEYLEGMILGNYQFLKYFKDKPEKKNSLSVIKIESRSLSQKSLGDLKAVLDATCKARDLVNEPLSFLSAVQLSKEIQKLGKQYGFSVKVLDKKKITEMKMGGVLAVNKGSIEPPTFSIMEWKPSKCKNKKPVVLVGKGIVYDTGGLSLKPTANSMDMMKCDMAGAATVVGAMIAVAKAKLPLHLIGLIPSTDNRPGANAYVPGDVIKMYSGDTVEVLNTDAEGRLVLADALHYAKRFKPELVFDFATLTGSAVRACGSEAIAYMGNTNQQIKEKIERSGFNVYERLIEFPLWKEYGEQLKSNIADLKNLGGSTAGMITAGKFLEYFTDYSWLHFDIAGPAYLKVADAYRTKEGTGVGVRLMFDFLKNY